MANGTGTPGIDYFVITQEIYDALEEIFGESFLGDFFQLNNSAYSDFWFAKQSDIIGDEYDDIVNTVGSMNLGTAFFTRSNEPNFNWGN